jgi:hypothetical protein
MNPDAHHTSSEDNSQRPSWLTWVRRAGWGVLLLTLATLPIGALVVAFDMLMGMPERPNCHSRLWMEKSDANRLYCAQTLADERTPESLERAIALVDGFPDDHPLRDQSDRFLNEWSFQLLDVADDRFQSGSLDEAIAIANRIPPHTDAYNAARDRITIWQETWTTAEDLYTQVENALALGNWETALVRARELRFIENDYWARVRYDEVARRAQAGREAEQQMASAERQRTEDSTDEWRNKWETERDAEDLAALERAQAIAQAGTVNDLQEAIAMARRVIWGTTHYDRAQDLIATWQYQLEVSEDAPRLNYARQLAESGEVDDLEATIDEARDIPSYRSLHDEARSEIEQWQQQIRDLTRESMDSPIPTEPSGNASANDPINSSERSPGPVWITDPSPEPSSTDSYTDSYSDTAPRSAPTE